MNHAINNYFVTKEVVCPTCGGSGVETRFQQSDYDGKVYPWDVDCPRCNGDDVIRVEVSLEDALIDLGILKPEPKEEIPF